VNSLPSAQVQCGLFGRKKAEEKPAEQPVQAEENQEKKDEKGLLDKPHGRVLAHTAGGAGVGLAIGVVGSFIPIVNFFVNPLTMTPAGALVGAGVGGFKEGKKALNSVQNSLGGLLKLGKKDKPETPQKPE
jgi:hypothetical protein